MQMGNAVELQTLSSIDAFSFRNIIMLYIILFPEKQRKISCLSFENCMVLGSLKFYIYM